MKHIVIIGNSAAGMNAAKTIRSFDKSIKITVVSEEQYPAYRRLEIAEILMNNLNPAKLFIDSAGFYEQEKIDFLHGKKVERVNPKKNAIILFDKTKIVYDALIVASGCSANVSKDVKGVNKHGVLGFRNISNVQDILELIPISNTVCVWGAGIAGINAAFALSRKKLEIKVISSKEHILPGVVKEEKARLIEAALKDQGIQILLNKSIVEVFGNGDVKAVKLDSGKVIGCGILILDKNLTPNTKFLENTEVNINAGVHTDEFLRSSVENIFAAGDVLIRKNIKQECLDLPNSWDIAASQGRVAGENALKFVHSKVDEMIAYSEDSQQSQLKILDLEFEPSSADGIIKEDNASLDCMQEDN